MTTQLKRFLPFVVACVVLGAGPASIASGAVVYAVGDVACDPTDADFNNGDGSTTRCRQKYTADIINNEINAGRAPDSIIVLGDLQYNSASLSNFNASYALSWGQTPVKSRTRPVIGNHEGTTSTSGAGYCSYFGAAAHCNPSGRQGNAAYYSFDVGDWHVVVINSNCTAAGGCEAGTPQYQWLASDLDANAGRACTMAVWHHPRWSSGHDGSNGFMQPIWQLFHEKGGDLVLSGHSHDYERFAPIDGGGAVNDSTGMRSFVVGTGGAFFTGLSRTVAPGSEVRQNKSFGDLKLTLNPTSYSWEWVTAPGSPAFSDSGAQMCRTPGPGPNPTPLTNPGPTPNPTVDTLAPNVVLSPRAPRSPRSVRASRTGKVAFRVKCPKAEQRCRITVQLKRGRKVVSSKKTVSVRGGKTLKVTLRLNKGTRTYLSTHARLKVTAVTVARDAAGNSRTKRDKVTLRAPRP